MCVCVYLISLFFLPRIQTRFFLFVTREGWSPANGGAMIFNALLRPSFDGELVVHRWAPKVLLLSSHRLCDVCERECYVLFLCFH